MDVLLTGGNGGGVNTPTLTAIGMNDDKFTEIVEREFGPQDLWPAFDQLISDDIIYS